MIADPYAYLSAVWAGGEDPLWPHLALVPGSALAGIAVGVGIVLERPKYSPAIHRIAFWLVVIGIAVESVCTIALFLVDERISGAQQSKILALETRLAARSVLASDRPGFVAALQPYHGQEYSLWVTAGNEARNFLCVLNDLLQKAEWKLHWPRKGEIVTGIFRSPCGEGFVRPDEISDAVITLNPNPTAQALDSATALLNAMRAANITVRLRTHAQGDELPPDVVGVIIGNKEP